MSAGVVRWGHWLSLALWTMVLLLFGLVASRADSSDSARSPFRIGFSSGLFTDVNQNDAEAAVKIWSDLIADERGFPVDPQTAIYQDLNAMRRALREGRVDAVGIDAIEYDALREEIRFDPLFFTFEGGSPVDRYVLLAHRDGPVRTPPDLQGRRLRIHRNARTCLAPLWLDLVFAEHGRGKAAAVGLDIAWETQLSQVVIPVFFQQSDACVSTRQGFNLMRELNPQLGKDLVVLAESSDIVTRLFAFRVGFRSPFRESVIASMGALDESVAGRQVLKLFQTEELQKGPASLLESALEMIHAHEQLRKGSPPL